jgi:hypothetical protein
MDRGAVIVLPIILTLIVLGWAWYLSIHFKRKSQLDMERQLSGHGPSLPTTEHTWSRHPRSSMDSDQTRRSSIFKLKHLITRKDSLLTSSSSSEDSPVPTIQEMGKWPRIYPRKSQATTPVSLLAQHTLPLTSTERPAPIYSRRESVPTSHARVLSCPLPITNPRYNSAPQRLASLSPTQDDKRWWDQVARRGSTSNAISRLLPILEPEVRAWEYEGRMSSTGYENRAKEETRLVEGCHRSWGGSRCESIVYDWTRPTDGEMQRIVGDSVGREGHG